MNLFNKSILVLLVILFLLIIYILIFNEKFSDIYYNDFNLTYKNTNILNSLKSLKPLMDPCLTISEMQIQQRKNLISLYGNPIDNQKKFNIRILNIPNSFSKLRIFTNEKSNGICIYIHGGGWCIGGYDLQDPQLNDMKNKTGQTIVSISYRLMGNKSNKSNDDIPICNIDCREAVMYIINNPKLIDKNINKNFKLTITGESAGAQLSLDSILYVTKILGKCPFQCASFLYGAFIPFGSTYNCNNLEPKSPKEFIAWKHSKQNYKYLTKELMSRWQHEYSTNFLNSAVNMSLNSFVNLCPAQFIVGSADMMLRNNIAIYSQWLIDGNDAQLIIYNGIPHGFLHLKIKQSKDASNKRINFLK